MSVYYNEFDPYAAAWLRQLIADGLIADGEVDERSIESVRSDDLRGFKQCHFFAGIGGWSYALRLAGWPDDRPVWTGSCPCQPFSGAGKGRGKDDARHLWPQFRRLIRQCRPAVVFGEQVASKAGRTWLSAVFADLEALAYRAAGADLCGPSVGAWDIRQRLWFVADTNRERRNRERILLRTEESRRDAGQIAETSWSGEASGLAVTEHAEWRALRVDREDGCDRTNSGREEAYGELGTCGEVRVLADADVRHAKHRDIQRSGEHGLRAESGYVDGHQGNAERKAEDSGLGDSGGARLPNSQRAELSGQGWKGKGGTTAKSGDPFWADVEWLHCADGTYRPTEPGLFPLAYGVSGRVVIRRTSQQASAEIQDEHWYNRVGALRGFGNAIKPQVAAAFIEAYCSAQAD